MVMLEKLLQRWVVCIFLKKHWLGERCIPVFIQDTYSACDYETRKYYVVKYLSRGSSRRKKVQHKFRKDDKVNF